MEPLPLSLISRGEDGRLRKKGLATRGRVFPWRWRALWGGARSLIDVGGIDLAASLAYYTLLSFIPFVALLVLVSSVFASDETIRSHMSQVLGIYFPASSEFLDETITPLLDGRPVSGVISLVAVMWGANGLFMATNRNVNRVFRSQQMPILRLTFSEVILAVGVIVLFLLSIGLSALFRVGADLAASYEGSSQFLNELAGLVLRVLFVSVPPFVTFLVFATVYDKVPTISVPWRDSSFGALMAVVLFEAAKYIFFWVTSTLGHQSVVYGPLTSVIVLLIWSHMGAMIFLFGASVAQQSMSLRPRGPITAIS